MAKKNRDWLQRQAKDIYVKASKKDGYRSRASYKLLEMQDKYRLFKPGMHIIELGAAPGGWSQVAAQSIGQHGKIYAVDLLPMSAIDHVEMLQMDINDEAFDAWLTSHLGEQRCDWVISDMAPNMSGHQSTDQLRSIQLCEETLVIASRWLKPEHGGVLMKCFQGEGFIELKQLVRSSYQHCQLIKPKASERSAREIYILGRGYQPS